MWLLNEFTECLAVVCLASDALQASGRCMYADSGYTTLLNCLQLKFGSLLSYNLQCFDCLAQSASSGTNMPAALQEM